jgi:hypothetical protein
MWHALVVVLGGIVAGQADIPVEKASEGKGLLQPTPVRLDFQERSLAEIVEGINAQAPGSLELPSGPQGRIRGGPAAPGPAPRRYSLREAKPVTFWEAVDRVARASHTLPVSAYSSRGGRARCVQLVPASPDRGFVCNDGAFRVIVRGTFYDSGLQFAPYFFNQPGIEQPKPDGTSRRPRLSAGLTVAAEPRLKIHRPVALEIREAVDDQGRSLLEAVPWRHTWKGPEGVVRAPGSEQQIVVPLKVLEEPGKTIQRLRGTVTVEVSAHTSTGPTALAEVAFDFADVPLP